MILDTHMTLALLQELLMALRANDADGYKSWLALGIEEAFFEACCLIEWPERITALLPDSAMHLYLGFGEKEESRILNLSAPDAPIHNNAQNDAQNNAQKKLASWLADII